MKTLLVPFVMAALAFAPIPGRAAPPDAKKAAVSAATSWLALVDEGRYADSWTQASTFFRTSITQAKWSAALEAVRRPLGKRTSRTLDRATESSSLPGAPPGRYVVMQFKAVFAGRPAAIETVTFMLEMDGAWRSAGYFIK